jgi:multidrug resistance efflux pump
MLRKFWLQGLSVIALSFAVIHMVAAYQTVPKVPPPKDPPTSPFSKTLAGAGMVEAQTENISIGSNVPGIVREVMVKVGDEVKFGDVLFRLDERQMAADEKVKEAAVRAARASLDQIEKHRKEELPVNEAKVREMEAMLREAEDQLARGHTLANQGALAREEMVTRERAAHVARAQLARERADLALLKSDAWQAELEVARVAIVQAESQLQSTRQELERLRVTAWVPGRVLQVNVRPGEYVGAPPGQALIVLGSTDRLHVRVDIDEHDIPRYRPGIPATASIRGNPGTKLNLTFVRVEPYVIPKKSLTGSNTERVDTRVLQVIYALESTAQPVYVGQQLDVFFNADAPR